MQKNHEIWLESTVIVLWGVELDTLFHVVRVLRVYGVFQEMAESVTSDILLALSSNNPYHRELVFLFVGMKYRRCQDVNPSYMITRQVFKTII